MLFNYKKKSFCLLLRKRNDLIKLYSVKNKKVKRNKMSIILHPFYESKQTLRALFCLINKANSCCPCSYVISIFQELKSYKSA